MNAGISKETLERLARESGIPFGEMWWNSFSDLAVVPNNRGGYAILVKWYHSPREGENLYTSSGWSLETQRRQAVRELRKQLRATSPDWHARAESFVNALLEKARKQQE